MELIQYDNPFERAQNLIKDYARALYGIEDASSITVLCEIAFNEAANPAHRLTAAKELAAYELPRVKPIELIQPKAGPDFVIEVLGAGTLDESQSAMVENQLREDIDDAVIIEDSVGIDGNAKLSAPDETIDDDMREDW